MKGHGEKRSRKIAPSCSIGLGTQDGRGCQQTRSVNWRKRRISSIPARFRSDQWAVGSSAGVERERWPNRNSCEMFRIQA